jgi:hypothetical protein
MHEDFLALKMHLKFQKFKMQKKPFFNDELALFRIKATLNFQKKIMNTSLF